MDRTALSRAVRRYISERKVGGFGVYFAHTSYAKWAAAEVLRCLEEAPNKPPESVVESFARKMDRYAASDGSDRYMFSVAYDVALDILDKFIL